jgi:hypothetical protein
MPFPRTRDELVAGGYKFSNHARCKACQAEVEWWETSRGKKMPFNLMQDGNSPSVTHFVDCPGADLFRKPR